MKLINSELNYSYKDLSQILATQKPNIFQISIILLFLVLIYPFRGCKQATKESEVDSTLVQKAPLPPPIEFDLDKIKARDTIRAIVDNSSTSFFIYKGRPMGFEYELLVSLAKNLGVTLKLLTTPSIDEAFKMLNRGDGDIIAYNLSVTAERKKIVKFTRSYYTSRQVLIQKKPDNWRKMKLHEIEDQLIRNQVDLINKEVTVRSGSSFIERLQHLSEEIGGQIQIVEASEDEDTESLIRKVATGEIKYTIADDDIALVNASYYPNIDVKTPVSFPQRIAWAVRLNADSLLNAINSWLAIVTKEPTFNYTYNKYFRNHRMALIRATSDYSSIQGGRISNYDDMIKQWADSLGWDWKLLASQVYQESKFNPRAESWAGAQGLMQLVPETGRQYGAKNLFDPSQSIKAGVRYLKYLDKVWTASVTDPNERIKFVLASYNVGLGHVIDARNLARKYGKDPTVWDYNVAYYLLHKSNPQYYKDPVVESGYCKGEEPIEYVNEIMERYDIYKQLLSS